jgi:S1-C subfamily serine protease
VAEEIRICPSCGSQVGEGRTYIDDYRIVEVTHEGHATLLCHAVRERTGEEVMIRLFKPQSGVNEEVAERLRQELGELSKLPPQGFVKHYAIRQSLDGLWYRISEWVPNLSWGDLLASSRLHDRRVAFDLFAKIASTLQVLHQHGHIIPHLILDDIIVLEGEKGELQVKIDYKLSRFFDPKMDRPGPMLKHLLECHPDIVHNRPLDIRSDIWSLGKVFVELLSADLETRDYQGKIEELDLPPELQILLRVMLASDPDLRPKSMKEIEASIQRIQENLRRQAPPSVEEVPPPAPAAVRKPRKAWLGLAVIVVLLILAGLVAWFAQESDRRDVESKLESYANQYAQSVAFLLVEYWLEVSGERVYRNVAEGTAFLVDRDGYMLTSRHVTCPWLEDSQFQSAVQLLKMRDISPRFRYRMFLWFEGKKAYNRAGRMIESPEVADFYFVENAFSNETPPLVRIAGIAKPHVRLRQLFTAPLKDDFAVIKVDKVPSGVVPIPLDLEMDPRKLAKLTRVIALGFPLGSRTQTDTVNVSVVRGNIRRSFENMFQIDASLHGGNSGGPVIDGRGKVIGIVSAVALDFTQGLVPMITPVWDIGLILPIREAVELLNDLKAGQAKWNGVLDFSQETALVKIKDTAARGRWAEAMHMADEEVAKSLQPALVAAAGMLHFCNGDYRGARLRFSQSLSMDPDDNEARLMLVLIDWLSGPREAEPVRRQLLAADWRSAAEFQGYLARVLEGSVSVQSALKGWYTPAEKSRVYYIGGLLASREGKKEEAERLLQEAVLSSEPDSWEFLLSRVMLENVRKERRKALQTDEQWAEYSAQIGRFEALMRDTVEGKKELQEKLTPLWARLADTSIPLEEKRRILEEVLDLDPENRMILATLADSTAALEAWPEALDYLGRFLKGGGRQNAVRMSLGLLEAGIFHYKDQEKEAHERLNDFSGRVRDPWFLTVCEYLRGRQTEESIAKEAQDRPEDILTAYTAMGFWAEGSKDKKKALRFYREALGTFLADWLQYDFAKERVKRLKQASN